MTQPVRIQRRRTKGFRLQEASPNGLPVVYVGRGTPWGNPFRVSSRAFKPDSPVEPELFCDHPEQAKTSFGDIYACEMWEDYDLPSPDEIRRTLRGKNLACWCPMGQPCHADVLLEIANQPAGAVK